MPYVIDSISADNVNVNKTMTFNNQSTLPNVYTQLTYAELKAKYDAAELIPGSTYEITDYQTLHIIPNTTERNDTNVVIPVERLVVQAISNSELSPYAYSLDYPDDVIQYDITGDYLGSLKPVGVKGAITYRKFNFFECSFDFRHVVVRTWCYEMQTAWYSQYGYSYNFSTNNIARGWYNVRPTLQITNFASGGTPTSITLVPESLNLYDPINNVYGYKDQYMFKDNPNNSAFGTSVRGVFFSESAVPAFCIRRPNNTDNYDSFYIECVRKNINNVICVVNSIELVIESLLQNSRFITLRIDAVGTGYKTWFGLIRAKGFSQEFITVVQNIEGSSINLEGDIRGLTVANTANFYSENSFLFNSGIAEILVPNASNHNPVYHFYQAYLTKINPPLGRCFYYNQAGRLGRSTYHTISTAIMDNRFKSTEERTIEAVSGITLSTTDLAVAGILNLTGSGVVNIATLTRQTGNSYLKYEHPITLRPASGLTISIARNNVANGFIQPGTVTADGTNGEVIRLELVNDRWLAMN